MATSRFQGFPKKGVSWFQALALNQTRAWFQANRGGYEAAWVAPMTALLDGQHRLRARRSATRPL
jgi:uncharacterized protein (DUF2461 family)